MLQTQTLLRPAFTSEWSSLKAAFLVGFSWMIMAVMLEHSFCEPKNQENILTTFKSFDPCSIPLQIFKTGNRYYSAFLFIQIPYDVWLYLVRWCLLLSNPRSWWRQRCHGPRLWLVHGPNGWTLIGWDKFALSTGVHKWNWKQGWLLRNYLYWDEGPDK